MEMSTASFLLSATGMLAGGAARSESYSAQAKAEEFNSRNRQIERKRNLIQALSMQNVKAGASGISGGVGSSQQAIAQEDIRLERVDSALDIGATSQRVRQLQVNASNASTYNLLSAGAEVAGGVSRSRKRGSL